MLAQKFGGYLPFILAPGDSTAHFTCFYLLLSMQVYKWHQKSWVLGKEVHTLFQTKLWKEGLNKIMNLEIKSTLL